MPAFGTPPFFVFAFGLLVTLGGWLVLMTVLVKYRMHYSWHFGEGLKRLFGPEGKPDRRRAGVGLAVMFAGMPVWMVGSLIGDSARNAPCREACHDQGYRSGRFRRSPHDVVNGRSQGPYLCWCFHSEQDWAPEPLDLPPAPP